MKEETPHVFISWGPGLSVFRLCCSGWAWTNAVVCLSEHTVWWAMAGPRMPWVKGLCPQEWQHGGSGGVCYSGVRYPGCICLTLDFVIFPAPHIWDGGGRW